MLSRLADETGGDFATYQYEDSQEVSGILRIELPEGADEDTVAVMLAGLSGLVEEFRTGTYARELFYQGSILFRGGGEGDSPLDVSRTGPDGKQHKVADTNWMDGNRSEGDAIDGVLGTLRLHVLPNVMVADDTYEPSRIDLRQRWSPVGQKPKRRGRGGRR